MSSEANIIAIVIDNKRTYIRLDTFRNLFESSHIYYKKEYQNALQNGSMKFKILQKLAREANIPYSLFFAPNDYVENEIERNNTELFKGVDSGVISMSGRGSVETRDIGLIIKDILKRQILLNKEYPNIDQNTIKDSLRSATGDILQQAQKLISIIDFDLDEFRSFQGKEKAYDYLVNLFEKHNILVSRSRIGAMPQSINKEVTFSGVTVKHKKFPSIFLYSKDETMVGDPTGRRIFTLLLLLVCIAKGKYSIVSYNSRSEEIIEADEYRIVEEILVPSSEVEGLAISKIQEIRELSDTWKVTPRAALVILRRNGCIEKDNYNEIYEQLDDAYLESKSSGKSHPWTSKDTTKVKTYCGIEFTKKAFELHDMGRLSEGDLRRLLLFNKKPRKFLGDLRDTL
ncbi:hypothetical protein EOM57_04515 [Candidatus Saccharibacteria bacterium]|nr:hypothetical protein [Candidatus Saccharibacteria bacterium]